MPEKEEKQAKHGISAAKKIPAVSGAPPPKRAPAGLHKRVLSAAHSLVRGVRSSKSASTGRIVKKKSFPAAARVARPTGSASSPARKVKTREQEPQHQADEASPALSPPNNHPLPQYLAHRRPQRANFTTAADAPRRPFLNSKLDSRKIEEEKPFQKEEGNAPQEEDNIELGFQEDYSGSFFSPEENNANQLKFLQQRKKKLQKPVDMQQEENPSEQQQQQQLEKLVRKEPVLQALNIENDLKKAIPDEYHAVLKASLRKIAVFCNDITIENSESSEDQELLEKNFAQRLTNEKLLGKKTNFNTISDPSPRPLPLPFSKTRITPPLQEQHQEEEEGKEKELGEQRDAHTEALPWHSPLAPSLSLPLSLAPPTGYQEYNNNDYNYDLNLEDYQREKRNTEQHNWPQQQQQQDCQHDGFRHQEQQQSFNLKWKDDDEDFMDFLPFKQRDTVDFGKQRTKDARSDGSSPLLSLNSADFDLN